MRQEPNLRADKIRVTPPGWSSPSGANFGLFRLNYRGHTLMIISSGCDDENGWEHVSVSHATRCPTWQEMQHIKEVFWRDDEVVLQFHPAKADYVNFHPHCLHMWRPINQAIPIPPAELVGPIV